MKRSDRNNLFWMGVGVLMFILGTVLAGCLPAGSSSDGPTPRRDVIVGVATDDLASVDVLIATRDGGFTKIGRVASGRPLCFHWTLLGPVGRIRSYDARGRAITVEFEPWSADAWTWTVSLSDWPHPMYGEAKCAWEAR